MSAEQAAEWMLAEVKKSKVLYQNEAVAEVADRFGDVFAPENERGNPSIHKDVLKAFRAISGDTVVWDRTEKCWRLREAGDDPGRMQY